MLEFVDYEDDSTINIRDERGDAVGDLVINGGKYNLSLLYLIKRSDYLRQIADKLDELNE